MVHVSIGNLVIVTGLAVFGIIALKWATSVFPVPGLRDIANSV